MEWIKVTDRLPELEIDNVSTYVLIATKFNDVWEAAYCYEKENWILPYSEGIVHGVTHWMPLPEPPKKD